MKLASLKMSKKERKEQYDGPATAGEYEGPEYPYGTTLRLDRDALKRIGISADNLPKAGTELTIEGKAYVKSSSVETRDKGDDRVELELQVTDLGCEESKDAAKAKKTGARINELSKTTAY